MENGTPSLLHYSSIMIINFCQPYHARLPSHVPCLQTPNTKHVSVHPLFKFYFTFLKFVKNLFLLLRLHSLSLMFFFPRYGTLLELGEKRKDMLEKSCKKFMLFREANELQQWIHEKESTLTNEEMGSDLEQVEVLQKKFDDFQKVMSVVFRLFCFLSLILFPKILHDY